MKIEINAGVLGEGLAVSNFQLNMAGFISNVESVISSFKAVQTETQNLNGGVGNLQNAADDISERIRQEEEKLDSAVAVRNKANDFLELAVRVDKQVASQVNRHKEQFYQKYPHLAPKSTREKVYDWGEAALNWLCDRGQDIVDGFKAAWEWTKDTASAAWDWVKDTATKAWNGIIEFYQEHKKIIDTIFIVVGAVAAIAAVVFTGGAALAPLLGAIGLSTTAAATISTAVAVIAVVSTVASSTMNLVDTWAEIDDSTFNAWQKSLNIVSGVSNLVYSVGNIYNSVKGINPQEYVAAGKAADSASPVTTIFDDSTPIAQDTLRSDRYFAKGDHYDEFADFWESGADGYTYTRAETPQTQYIKAKDIEGVYLNQSEVSDPTAFWNKRYSKGEYMDFVSGNGIDNAPVQVTKVNDSFYYFEGDGRHRILAAQEMDIEIPVIIKGFYTK